MSPSRLPHTRDESVMRMLTWHMHRKEMTGECQCWGTQVVLDLCHQAAFGSYRSTARVRPRSADPGSQHLPLKLPMWLDNDNVITSFHSAAIVQRRALHEWVTWSHNSSASVSLEFTALEEFYYCVLFIVLKFYRSQHIHLCERKKIIHKLENS